MRCRLMPLRRSRRDAPRRASRRRRSCCGRQTAYQLRSFRRIPIAVFFTLGLPLIMLVLFNALFGSTSGRHADRIVVDGAVLHRWAGRFTAVSATFTNLANMVPLRRDEGVLKRWRGTPLPRGCTSAGSSVRRWPSLWPGRSPCSRSASSPTTWTSRRRRCRRRSSTFLIGVSAFAAIGMALAAVVKSASSASAAANAIILPLAFVSSVFVQLDDAPRWLEIVGDVFPLKPFVESFQACFNPTVAPPAFDWAKMAVVARGGSPGWPWRSNGSVGSRAVRRLAVVALGASPRAEARPQENTTVLRP